MGAPPDEEQVADMLSNPAMAQMMNEALQNPAMIDMMIQQNPHLRAMGPDARRMLQSPMFRQMMTDPQMLRQAAQMRRMMGGGAGGASSFPAPGVTDTTPSNQAGTTAGTANADNPFGSLFGAQAPGEVVPQELALATQWRCSETCLDQVASHSQLRRATHLQRVLHHQHQPDKEHQVQPRARQQVARQQATHSLR